MSCGNSGVVTLNQRVAGSIPVRPTKTEKSRYASKAYRLFLFSACGFGSRNGGYAGYALFSGVAICLVRKGVLIGEKVQS